MKFESALNLALISAISTVLLACGGPSDEPDVEQKLVPPEVNQAKIFDGPLVKAGNQSVTRFIKNGIYATSLQALTSEDVTHGAPSPSPTADSSNMPFSRTNTIEQGVDEADRVKYDGNVLYLANYPTWTGSGQTPPHIRVLRRESDFNLTPMPDIDLSQSGSGTSSSDEYAFGNIQGLYLSGDRLAALGSRYPVYAISDMAIEPWLPVNEMISISLQDVQDPSDISEVSLIQLEGALLSSRRIDQQLYVVSSFVPYVSDLQVSTNNEATRLQNYQTIINTPIEQLMPKIITKGQSTPMNAAQDCLIPQQASQNDGYAQIVTVTRINLNEPSDYESLCLSVFASSLYMSERNLYLLSSSEEYETVLHKFSLDSFSYQASGKVNGQLGWRTDPLFMLDEDGDYFRIVTSDYSQPNPIHQLSILKQQGNQLNLVAKLPNDNQPEPIGKPGEEIYAVRFVQDKAYVVTFEQVDPLYVIDLADNTMPQVVGALEIPGFSSYLHPLDNGFLLGVGQEVSLFELPATGTAPVTVPRISGMKVSLFDVRDPANPLEIGTIVTPHGYTPVEYNYKALSVLNNQGIYRFAMPVEEWPTQDETLDSFVAYQNSLMLLEVDTNQASPNLTEIEKVTVSNDENYYIYSGEDRSVIHGDNVYYIHGNRVWLANWAQSGVYTGPF